jgi:lipopolysaccharide export system protein LptC
MSTTGRPASLRLSLWRAWDRASIYLPVILMGLMALGTYWLARHTPSTASGGSQRAVSHDPDYFMRDFSVKTFEPNGRLKSEIYGKQARHYPDTDTLEIDQPRVRSFSKDGVLTTGTGRKAVSNADGTEVQLIGDAVVTRAGSTTAQRREPLPTLEIRSEFLHFFSDTEKVRTHKPVVIIRGDDQLEADSMEYDNLERILQLNGRVRGTIAPRRPAP